MGRIKASYIVIGYNHARFAAEAVQSALAQEYEDMEFIFSDDFSTDGTFEKMQAAASCGDKQHRPIKILRTPKNLGLSRHLGHVFSQAAGDVFILQSADDIALPQRAAELMKIFEVDSKVKMAMSNVRLIDERGGLIKPEYAPRGVVYVEDAVTLARGGFAWIVGASEAIRREVYEAFGPPVSPACWEDYMFAFRASLLGRIVFCDQVLLEWRHHQSNMSHHADFSGGVESRRRFEEHFLKNLRSHLVYQRQHLVDLEKARSSLSAGLWCALEDILLNAKYMKHLEYAARRGAPWRFIWRLCLHARARRQKKSWLVRQVMIRLLRPCYFRSVYNGVRARLRRESNELPGSIG
jgi:GT2 family glycosyltransferase